MLRFLSSFLVCVLSICAIFSAFLPMPLYAAPEANPTYIQWSGQYRSRFESLHRPAAVSGDKTNRFTHQVLLSAHFKAQENLDFKASLLGFENWGKDYYGFAGYPYPEVEAQEVMHLYEAYARWDFASGISFQVGRFPFEVGNGLVFSKNLDDDLPTRFDGGHFQYQTDLIKFKVGGFAISDWASAGSTYKDRDYKLYFLSADLDIIRPYLENISISFLSVDKDEKDLDLGGTSPAVVTLPKEEKEIYALSLAGEHGRAFYSFDGVIQQGENHSADQSIQAYMLHARVGGILYRPWNFGIYVQGHQDTGDKVSTADRDETYDPLFYNHFQNAGKMNLLGWGNLTYYSLGFSWALKERHNLFLEYNHFLRTSTSAGTFGLGPSGGAPIVWDEGSFTDGPINNRAGSGARHVGDEIDFTYELQSGSGVRFQSVTGIFMPGQYLEDHGKEDAVLFQRLGLSFAF